MSAPEAACARAISWKLRYFPVPTIRRDWNPRPAMTSRSDMGVSSREIVERRNAGAKWRPAFAKASAGNDGTSTVGEARPPPCPPSPKGFGGQGRNPPPPLFLQRYKNKQVSLWGSANDINRRELRVDDCRRRAGRAALKGEEAILEWRAPPAVFRASVDFRGEEVAYFDGDVDVLMAEGLGGTV